MRRSIERDDFPPRPARSLGILLSVGVALFAGTLHAAEGGERQALTTNRLKVCADPANLPFSNDSREGFENRVIELIADELGLEARYTWYPQSTGFVRNTLRLRSCDLISGITTTSETVQNTNPYYHSVYTMVYREDSGLRATTMADPSLAGKRVGVVAGTPPADVLARLGRLADVQPYQLIADTRVDQPALDALGDVVDGDTEAAFIWGPIAGWYATTHPDARLVVVPLVDEPDDIRMDFRVSMAVRYNETEWKHEINRALKARESEIATVLQEYGIPLLDDRGRPVAPAALPSVTSPPEASPPAGEDDADEPVGYRMQDYDAPVPSELAGARTVAAAEVRRLIDDRQAVVVDVIPAPRPPSGLDPDALWLPPDHVGLADALWLPDTGFGALAEVTERYLFDHLERATGGERDRPLVFYCRMGCWMSWNAARRALQHGYRDVSWYRDGIDDWTFEDGATAVLVPAPGPRLPGDFR